MTTTDTNAEFVRLFRAAHQRYAAARTIRPADVRFAARIYSCAILPASVQPVQTSDWASRAAVAEVAEVLRRRAA